MCDYTNAFFIFLLFFLYGITLSTFTYMLSAFFSKAKTAGIFGVVFTILFYFPDIFGIFKNIFSF